MLHVRLCKYGSLSVMQQVVEWLSGYRIRAVYKNYLQKSVGALVLLCRSYDFVGALPLCR
jgi:hypothetical protein